MHNGVCSAQGRLAAVVLTLGVDDSFKNVVADLLAQGMAPTRICVVHNRVAAAEPPAEPGHADIQVIELARNLGYSGGMNAGLSKQMAGDAEWIWVLTQDVVLRPHALATLASAAAGAHGYGALGPTLYDRATGGVFSRGGVITRSCDFVHALSELPADADASAGGHVVAPCDWVDGACLLLRVKALATVGLFDERFHSYCEDVDICRRLKQAGWSVGTVNDSEAAQSVGQSRRPGAYAYLITRNTLECRHRSHGKRAVAQGTAKRLWLVGSSIKQMIAARHNVDERYRHWAIASGTCCGILAYFARRWGPPPTWLPGRGDLRPPTQVAERNQDERA